MNRTTKINILAYASEPDKNYKYEGDISDMSGLKDEERNYQCKRMSSLFKYVYADGTVKYRDVDRYHGVNINCPDAQYHSGLIDTVMDELYPITMPYICRLTERLRFILRISL